ncbi:MAG: radical SAM protein [Clostridiales bacterium]|nr:radical SAM protein [Clostridiales bacterium]
MKCTLCPRNCNVDRSVQAGVCRTDGILLSRVARHDWEEPCISGDKGSGTVFFAGCNLHCRFCQNYDISVRPHGVAVSVEALADIFLYIQQMGWANINLVTPSHFSDKIAQALALAKPYLNIPVVYNTSGYEKVAALAALDGLVDVYMPDLKFCSTDVSLQLAGAIDYFEVATKAITEMRRQQPCDVFDSQGYMTQGVIVRHLVLPSFVEDSKRVLDWLSQFDRDVYVSLMSQYFPARKDDSYPQLNRRLYNHEYESVRQYFFNVGLHNGFSQDVASATVDYLPEFSDGTVLEALNNAPCVFRAK